MFILFLIQLLSAFSVNSQTIDHRELKCLVCRKLVDLMEHDIYKVDPNKKVDVGSFRIDHKGDQIYKAVEYRRSEIYLTELMEKICDKMEDFVRARRKSNGELIIFNLITEGGQMNPIMSEVDVVQDSDLNKSLKFYCEGILEENDEAFVNAFKEPGDNVDIKICTEISKLCNQTIQEDYEFETHEEL